MPSSHVGFIGGGQMAQALIGGALDAGILNVSKLVVAEPAEHQQKALERQFAGVQIVSDGADVFRQAERVVLAVKPQVLTGIAESLKPSITKNHLVVSIAAGISLPKLQSLFGTKRIIRVMPNTPAQIGAGAAAFAADADTESEDIAWVERLMQSVGTVVRVPDELIHAVTGVAGSSPAYFYEIIEAMSDGGVAMGLPRDVAVKLSAQAMMGSAKMVLESGLHPGQLKDQVTSPGGTTIAALRTLEAAGVRSAFIEAVAACVSRSKELGD